MPYDLCPQLRELADLQQGILTSRQAIAGGLTKAVLRSRVRQGRWLRLQTGVYAVFSGEPPRSTVLWAAVLRAGPGAMLSHLTAAEVSGIADAPSTLIHITVPAIRRLDRIPGLVLHRSERTDQSRHPAAAPPRTRVEETVLDLTDAAADFEAAYGWVTRAVGRRLTTGPRLSSAMGLRSRLRWRAELAAALGTSFDGVHSGLEYRYLRDVERRHALPRATRQARARLGGRSAYRDVLYEKYGVAVELDGQVAHPGDLRWRDIGRDNAAAADGIITLRYGWLDVSRQPCLVAAQLDQVLRQRGYDGAQACGPGCLVAARPAATRSRP